MHVARVRPIDWPVLIQRLESAGVDVAWLCRADPTTLWRWKVGYSKPGADHAVELWERDRTHKSLAARAVA